MENSPRNIRGYTDILFTAQQQPAVAGLEREVGGKLQSVRARARARSVLALGRLRRPPAYLFQLFRYSETSID